METESLNRFRFAKCLVTVGTEVLHELLMFNIQTCCFSEYHKLWLEKVNFHSLSNDLKVLWNSLDQQYRALDASSQQILQSLFAKWKSSCEPTSMGIRQQLSVLKDWEDDVHDFISNHATQQDSLRKWSGEMQSLVTLNTSLLTSTQNWTHEFFKLCQVDQLDLVRLTERHHERTNNVSAAFLNKLECCIRQGPVVLKTILEEFQQKEVNLDQELKTELHAFFISWQPKIDKLLDSWITLISSRPHQQILQNLATDVKKGLPRVHQMCETGLQNICSTWRANLQKMLSDWGNQLQQVDASPSDIQDLAKTWHKDIQAFPPASDQQIREFFYSKRHDLQRLKSRRIIMDPQWSSLYPTHGYIDVRKFHITLLSALHRHVFPICSPELGWSGEILETDHSMGADLMRLKQFRNCLLPVPARTAYVFEKLWITLGASLKRLSKALDDKFKEKVNQKIDELQTCPFDFIENIQLKFDLLYWNQGDTYEQMETCVTQEAFRTEIDPMKEMVERVKESTNRVEQFISQPNLSWTEMLEGMGSISERMNRMDTRMTQIETFISNQTMNRTKLEKRIDTASRMQLRKDRPSAKSCNSVYKDLMRGRVERHKSNNSDFHVRTRAFDHARDILLEQKHIVLQGKPGEGKTYLALSLVADLIEMDKEIAPVEIHNTNEWDEMVDIKLPLVIFLDDVLGKYGASETDLDRWEKISELIHPRLRGSSIFLIVCIRTQIASFINSSLRRNKAFFLFNSHVVDISAEPHCLTKEEREQMLMKYAPQDGSEKFAFKDIVEMENVIGFAQNCKILSSSQNVSVDLKEMFGNNMFLVEEIQDMSKKSPEMYTFLVLLMLSGGSLSLENKLNQLNEKIKQISDCCGLKKLNIGEMKNISHSLCGTLLEYNKKTKKFKFQHDCIETAVFVSFGNDYPYVTLEHCSLKQLCKVCCVANESDRVDGEDFLNFKIMIGGDHFSIIRERFNEGLESSEKDSFQSIAEALVWNDRRFVHTFSDTITFEDDVLNFLSKRDADGQSLLIHFINAKSTLVVKRIIKSISDCRLRDHNLVDRQLLLATTNACLTEDKEMLNDLIKLRDKVDDFVMLAAASTGNISILEMLVTRGGNINATISLKNRKDLANAIKTCIYHPKISSYHYDVNLLHIACSYGLTDMVKYLMNSYPGLVHKTSSLGYTAVHFIACSENVKLIKDLKAEQEDIIYNRTQPATQAGIDISARDKDGSNALHIASGCDNLPIVNYLIENNSPMLLQKNNKGWTAMHHAAQGGSILVMETLMQAGLDINTRTNDGRLVLHIAALNDNLPIVKYLTQKHPHMIHQNNNNGLTALHSAAWGCSVIVMETLIKVGLDINARTNDGVNVLQAAAGHDNLPIVKYLIANIPSLTLQNDNYGCTAMHYAAMGGSVPVMETLIQTGLDINARTSEGSHVLHIAAINNNLPVVKYLIEHNPPMMVQNDRNGFTAMHYAAHGGSVPVMETLIQAGLDINARTNNVCHVLHIAAMKNKLPLLKYLIKTNPHTVLQSDRFGWTAVHYAAKGGSVPVMETLMQAGLDINARDKNGFYVLHIAAGNDNLPIVTYLVKHRPLMILQNVNNGWTAMHCAALRGSVPMIETLIQAGLDINSRSNDGWSVLHIAAMKENLSIVKYVIENNPTMILQNTRHGWTAMHFAAVEASVSVIETLIQAGVDINARSNDGSNVLHIAAMKDNLPIVKYLIENNPTMILQNNRHGCTAMHFAAVGASVSMMETLIQAGLDINAKTIDSWYVQHIAAASNNMTIVKYLIKNNPPVMLQKTTNGWTALHAAAVIGSVPIMETLIQAGLDINARTIDDCHLVHIAAMNNNLPIVKYLIEKKPPWLLQNNKSGWTAMHCAAKGGGVPLMQTLIQAGLDINARTSDGCHLLHIAVLNDNLPIIKYLLDTNPRTGLQTIKSRYTALHLAAKEGSVSTMEVLIEAGLDINAKSNDGINVLHMAAINNNLPICKYLIENNPQVLLQSSKDGLTAMHFAAYGGSVPVIQILLKAGLDINARTNDGCHVIHIAAVNDNLPIVKYLIENNPPMLLQNNKNGWTAMHYAAQGSSVPVIETLVQAGLDINARNNDGCHVLHIAAMKDNLPIVKYLIKNNQYMLLQNNKDGLTALTYAAAGCSVTVMETLIQAGLDINARSNDGLHVLHVAAEHDNLLIVKYLIANIPSLMLQYDNYGWTALHCAAQGGSVPMMETLIQAGLDINARTNDGCHVLHIAAKKDNLPIVIYLIRAKPPVILQKDRNGWTAMHSAAQGGSVVVMEILIQAGLEIYARTNSGFNVLHLSAWYNNLSVVKYLIRNNPPTVLQKDKTGWTAMHFAAKGGSVTVMETLIQAGLDINTRTDSGCNLLHIAATNDNLPIVKYLIENNPAMMTEEDIKGWTAMTFAASKGGVPVMETLIQAGLDINTRTSFGCHLLHIAAINDNLPIVKYLIENNPAMMTQEDTNGWTAMYYAAMGGSVPVMETLIQAGLDINAMGKDGLNVLHMAATRCNMPIVKYLIENYPELVVQCDKNGWTAMHYAAQGGSIPVMETLLQAGLDIHARTNEGVNVLDIAAMNDKLPIVNYMIERNPSMVLGNEKTGWTAMHFAAKGGSVSVMETLIQTGSDINARTNDGDYVVHIASANDNLPIIKYLIENKPLVILHKDKNGGTAIHSTAQGGSVIMMETLIQAGLDISAINNDCCHVLHIAAMNDNLPIVKYLIEKKPHMVLQKDKTGWTSMHFAAQGGSVPVMETLIHAGLDINILTSDGFHILHIAAMKDNLPIVKYLVVNFPQTVLEDDKTGWTAMHFAAKGGSVPVMEILIQGGLDMNTRTNDSLHVLHIAARNDNLPIVKYVIENNPPTVLQKDLTGWTAMHFAAQGGSVPVIETLIQAGLDINARTSDGFHVLDIAAMKNNLPIVKYLIKINPPTVLVDAETGWTAMHYAAKGGSVPVMETLIQAGLDINGRTNDGFHVLHIAARNDNLPIVKYVIENHPPMVLQSNKYGWTAMHTAAEGGSVPMIEVLIQAGLDINAITNDGFHVLHMAAKNDNLPLVKYLIDSNPRIIIQEDKNGRTAMHLAAEGGSLRVMETLRQAGLDIPARASSQQCLFE